MKILSSQRFRTSCVAIALTVWPSLLIQLVQAHHSRAETVQVGFTGVITGIADVGYLPAEIDSGDTLLGYYTYDLDVADTNPDPHQGYYPFTSMPTSIVVYADGGWVFRTDASNVQARFVIGDSLQWGVPPPADVYNFRSNNNTAFSIEAGWGLSTIEIIEVELRDESLSAVSNDGLPAAPPNLDAWPDRRVLFIVGDSWLIGAEVITTSATLPTAVGDGPPRVHGRLGSNVPNPFNPTTTIPYSIDRPAQVTLAIYGVGGSLVRRLINERLPAGDYETRWDGHDDGGRPVASGIYFYRLTIDGYSMARKAVLIK